jgi:hypothetical protein
MRSQTTPTGHAVTYVIVCGEVATPLTVLPALLDDVWMYLNDVGKFMQGKVSWDHSSQNFKFVPVSTEPAPHMA